MLRFLQPLLHEALYVWHGIADVHSTARLTLQALNHVTVESTVGVTMITVTAVMTPTMMTATASTQAATGA